MRKWSAKIPLYWKALIFSLIILAVSFVTAILFLDHTSDLLISYGIPQFFMDLQTELFRLFLFSTGTTLLLLWIFFLDVYGFLKRMGEQLAIAVQKKKLKVVFTGRQSKDVFGNITEQANKLLDMFWTFDDLKSARLSLEISSIKQLMNSISEAVILLDPSKLVTHINHPAEQLLGLAPGEVQDQLLIRYISDETFYQMIQDAVSDHRVVDQPLRLCDQDVFISVFPIKNRRSEILRIMVSIRSENPKAAVVAKT